MYWYGRKLHTDAHAIAKGNAAIAKAEVLTSKKKQKPDALKNPPRPSIRNVQKKFYLKAKMEPELAALELVLGPPYAGRDDAPDRSQGAKPNTSCLSPATTIGEIDAASPPWRASALTAFTSRQTRFFSVAVCKLSPWRRVTGFQLFILCLSMSWPAG